MTVTRQEGPTDRPVAPPPPSPRALGGYQPGLDGLRAVAVAAVLAYHAGFPWARGGYLGVSVFFTLSGFLVTSLLLHGHDRDGRIDLRDFWARRVRRLLPASLLGLVAAVLFGATVATRAQADELPPQVLAAAGNASNWLFIAQGRSYLDLFAAPSPVQHYWSLSIEEQFYLLLPVGLLAVLAVTRSRRAMGLVIGALAGLSAGWTAFLHARGATIDRLYYGTDTRMAEMLVGALLGVVLLRTGISPSRRLRRLLGGAGAVALVVIAWGLGRIPLQDGFLWSGGIAAFSVVTCVAIVGVLVGTGPLRLLAVRPVVAVGRVSYGLYVFHWPIFLWLTEARTGLSQWPLFALRLAVTGLVAVASFHLIEMPVRSGTLLRGRRRVRLALGPVALVLVVAAAFLAVPRGAASDPLATLQGAAPEAPPGFDDPVLDVLVIADEGGAAVADALAARARSDPSLTVTLAPGLGCDELTGPPGALVCASWAKTWPGLITRVDPDAVLFYVDGWPPADLLRLAPPGGPSDPRALATEVLGAGFDLLTTAGAPVVWTSSPSDVATVLRQRNDPFHQAMGQLLVSREDVRVTQLLPSYDPADPTSTDGAARFVRDELDVARRRAGAAVPRVMVVGDSQGRAIGQGLEAYEATAGGAVVWNNAAPGCGVVGGGRVIDLATDEPATPEPSCQEAVDAWSDAIATFDPDVVLVMSSVRDVQDRRLPGWPGFRAIGDPELDAHILDAYVRAVDVLGAGGARVVWMRPPCVRYVAPVGGSADAPRAFDPDRMDHLVDVVLPDLVRARPDAVDLFALDDILCPDGEFRTDIGDLRHVRPDGVHLSPAAARWLAATIDEEVIAPQREDDDAPATTEGPPR